VVVKRFVRRIVPYWVTAVVIGSFLPGPWKLALGTRTSMIAHPVDLRHRIVHLVTFGVTAVLFMLLRDRVRDRARAALAALLLGCAIEVLQFVTGLASEVEWWDLRDDFLGIAAAFVVVQVVSGMRRARVGGGVGER
jgi:hypothetical protein